VSLALTTLDAGLVALLLPLLVAFCLIGSAVLALIRTTEDDELVEQIRHGDTPDGDLAGWLATLRDESGPGPDDVPTEPVLAAWDGQRS
jgi:hypothetical protein